jgi:mechanosensitive ion channel-like protein
MTDTLAQVSDTNGDNFNILQSLQTGFTTFVNYLPQLIGALLILLIGFIIAKILDKIINKGLHKARVDDRLARNSGGRFGEKLSPGGQPSRLVGAVVFWMIMLFVISSAISALGIPALTGFPTGTQPDHGPRRRRTAVSVPHPRPRRQVHRRLRRRLYHHRNQDHQDTGARAAGQRDRRALRPLYPPRTPRPAY